MCAVWIDANSSVGRPVSHEHTNTRTREELWLHSFWFATSAKATVNTTDVVLYNTRMLVNHMTILSQNLAGCLGKFLPNSGGDGDNIALGWSS